MNDAARRGFRAVPPEWFGAALALFVVCLGAPEIFSFRAADHPDELLQLNTACLAFWRRHLGAGELPLWIPEKLHGVSIFDDSPCLAPFHPLAVLLPVLDVDAFVLAAWILHVAAAGAGMTHWLRLRGLNPPAACLGAVLLAGSSLFAFAAADGNLDNLPVLAAFPWALAAWTRAKDAVLSGVGRWGPPLAATIVLLGAPAWSGHTRLVAVAMLAWGLLAVADLCAIPRVSRRPLAMLLLICGSGALLWAAPWVVPALAAVSVSRTGAPPEFSTLLGHALPTWGLPMILHPRPILLDARCDHLGAVAILGLLPLLRPSLWRTALPLLGPAVLLVLLGMGNAGPLAAPLEPLLWLLYPAESMASALAMVLLAGLAATGLHALGSEKLRPTEAAVLLAVSAWVLWWGGVVDAAVYPPGIESVEPIVRATRQHGLFVCVAVALATIAQLRRPAVVATGLLWLPVIIATADGVVFHRRVMAVVPTEVWRPSTWAEAPQWFGELPPQVPGQRLLVLPQQGPRSFAGTLLGDRDSGHGWAFLRDRDPIAAVVSDTAEERALLLPPNFGVAQGTWLAGGRTKVPPMPYTVFAAWMAWGLPRPGAELDPPPGALRPGERGLAPWNRPELFVRLLETWTLSAVVVPEGTAALPGTRELRPGAPGATVSIRQVIDPRPPVVLSPSSTHARDAKEAVALWLDPRVDLRASPIVTMPWRSVSSADPARALQPDAVSAGRWSVTLPGGHRGGLVVFADRFHPGWEATVDGSVAGTLVANLHSLAVPVGPGHHQVEVRFRPPGLHKGLAAGALGLVLVLWLLRPSPRNSAVPGT